MDTFSGNVYFGGNPNAGGSSWLSLWVNSVAFQIGNFRVMWYGILIGVGVLCAVLYAFWKAKKFGINSDRMIDVIMIGLISGIIGARAYYVIFNFSQFKGTSFLNIISFWNGGLAIYGGIIAGLGIGYLACKWRKIPAAAMLDLASIGFLIGQMFGRWGNFANQEAFGSNTSMPWGMYSSETFNYLSNAAPKLAAQGITVNPLEPVHPCFLYESLWCLIGFVLLHIFAEKFKKYDGQIFLLYIFWYGFGRMIIEGFRTDSLMVGPLRVSQLVGAACVIISAIFLAYFKVKKRSVICGEAGMLLLDEQLKQQQEERKEKRAENAKRRAAERVEKKNTPVNFFDTIGEENEPSDEEPQPAGEPETAQQTAEEPEVAEQTETQSVPEIPSKDGNESPRQQTFADEGPQKTKTPGNDEADASADSGETKEDQV